MKYGPESKTVQAFLRHLKAMTSEQWDSVRTALDEATFTEWDAARDAARYAAADMSRWAYEASAAADQATAGDKGWWAAGYATFELLGAPLMRERGQPLFFLPMFGFASPEAVLAQDQTN